MIVAPPICYSVQSEVTSPKFAMNFAKGSGGHAIPADKTEDLRDGNAAFFGSPQIWGLITTAMADPNRICWYGDHAYFRRSRYYRITRNRLQHTGIPTPGRALSMQRLREVGVDMQPDWRTDGGHIVVCPNSPVYMKLFDIDAQAWAGQVVTELSKYTDRQIVVRWKAQAVRRPLYVDLVDAWCVVTFSSNAAVEGIAAGIPCITLADFAASRRMGRSELKDVENLYYPADRAEFLMTLAQNQFSFDEMASGAAWRIVCRDH